MMPRVLLVDDEQNFAASVIHFLELNRVVCDYCSDGKQGLNLLRDNAYDVIVSDINMPGINGYDMCAQLRENGCDTPVIMLSALNELDDKLTGFEHGADDYLTKPFELRELLARINSLAKRRSGQQKSIQLEALGLSLNINEHSASRDGQRLKLTPSAWTLLEALARAYPNPVSKKDLEYAIWGDDLPGSEALKVQIHRLRQSLDKPFATPLLHVINGFGFALDKPLHG